MNEFDLGAYLLTLLRLSCLAVGGALALMQDYYRAFVVEHPWLTPAAFSDAIAVAQAAPGPNILFIALMGLQMGGVSAALLGLVAQMLPSSLLCLLFYQWQARRGLSLGVVALRQVLGALAIGFVWAAGVLILRLQWQTTSVVLATGITLLAGWANFQWKVHPLLCIAAGAVVSVVWRVTVGA